MIPEDRKLLHTLPVKDMHTQPPQGQILTLNGLWEAVGPQLGEVRRRPGAGASRKKFHAPEVFVEARTAAASLLGTRWS